MNLDVQHERPCLTTFPNTEKRVENMLSSGEFFRNFQTLSRVFDIPSQSKLKLRKKQRNTSECEIIKVYAH